MDASDATIETILRIQANIKTSKKRKVSYLYLLICSYSSVQTRPQRIFSLQEEAKKEELLF